MARSALMLGASDGARLVGQRWSTEGGSPRAAVVLAHGMGEHSLRYDRLGVALAAAGYDVLAVDHRGHGRTAGIAGGALGDLGPRGWDGLVADYALAVRSTLGEVGVPVIALGHSMGSWAVQQYLLDHSDQVAAAVLSGTGALDQLATIVDPEAEVDLSGFNAPFEPARTDYDWLSRDTEEVDQYVSEPLCGFGLDGPSAAGMWANAQRLADPAALSAIRDGFPLYVLAGSADPVNGGLKWLDPLVERYRAAGVDVTQSIYPDGRHEMFNETNRDEVVADLIRWLDGLSL